MLPLHHHGPNVIVLLSFPTPTTYWYTVSMFKLSGKYKNFSTAVVYCCTVLWNRFFYPTYGLYTCKEFSAHGTISSYVVFQNIVIIAALPRVRWHRAISPQGSSSNGCCLCITMDQILLCSSLFPHPLLVYSMFKLSGVYQNISTAVVCYCCTVLLLTLHGGLECRPLECRPLKYRQYNKRQSGENVPGFSFHVCCMANNI